jgi:hypothetical protein
VEDMCYERRRAKACVDESAHHAQGVGSSWLRGHPQGGFFLFRVHITEKFLFRGKQIQKSRKRADSAIRLVGAFSEICT